MRIDIVKALKFFLALAMVLASFHPAGARGESNRVVEYRITINPGNSSISVEMSWNSQEDTTYPITSLRDFGGKAIAYPEGYFMINNLQDSRGNHLETTAREEGWEVRGEGELRLTYSLNLESLTKEAVTSMIPPEQYEASPYLPHVAADYLYLPGFFLFLYPEPYLHNGKFRVAFTLPEGWEVAHPWGQGETDGYSLLANALFAGELATERRGKEPELLTALNRHADQANLGGLQEFADRLNSILQQYKESEGALLQDKKQLLVLLVSVPGEVDERFFSIAHQAFENTVFLPVGLHDNILSLEFVESAESELLRVILTKLSFAPESFWFREGCASYLQLLLSWRAGEIGSNAFLDQLSNTYSDYLESLKGSQFSLAESGKFSGDTDEKAGWLLQGGSIAVASLDALLRERGSGLEPLLPTLLERQDEMEGRALGNEDLADALKALSGSDFHWFLEDHVANTAPIPLSYFSQLKLAASQDSANPGASLPSSKTNASWIVLAIALIVVFAIPFLLEPYALRPRKPGIIVSSAEEDEEDWDWED